MTAVRVQWSSGTRTNVLGGDHKVLGSRVPNLSCYTLIGPCLADADPPTCCTWTPKVCKIMAVWAIIKRVRAIVLHTFGVQVFVPQKPASVAVNVETSCLRYLWYVKSPCASRFGHGVACGGRFGRGSDS